MNKENKEEKKEIDMKEKQEKKEMKLKKKQQKKITKKQNKKADRFSIWTKILAAFLVAFMLLGTCYTFIYLVVNA